MNLNRTKVAFGEAQAPKYHQPALITYPPGSGNHFFRNDLDWNKLGEIITERFSGSGAKILIHGCSDGAEYYSLNLLLERIYGRKKAKELFSFTCKDIREEVIEKAQKGLIVVQPTEVSLIKGYLIAGPDSKARFQTHDMSIVRGMTSRKADPDLVARANFRQGDFMEDVKEKIDADMIFVRNSFIYMEDDGKKIPKSCLISLYENVNPGALLIVGGLEYGDKEKYEDGQPTVNQLINAGFRAVEDEQGNIVECIFEKPS